MIDGLLNFRFEICHHALSTFLFFFYFCNWVADWKANLTAPNEPIDTLRSVRPIPLPTLTLTHGSTSLVNTASRSLDQITLVSLSLIRRYLHWGFGCIFPKSTWNRPSMQRTHQEMCTSIKRNRANPIAFQLTDYKALRASQDQNARRTSYKDPQVIYMECHMIPATEFLRVQDRM